MADDFEWATIMCLAIVAGMLCLFSFPDVQKTLAAAPVAVYPDGLQ